MKNICKNLLVSAVLLVISSCSMMDYWGATEEGEKITGERKSPLGIGQEFALDQSLSSLQIRLPNISENDSWTKSDGSEPENYSHLSLVSNYSVVENYKLINNKFNFKDVELSGTPIIADDKIFVFNNSKTVSAYQESDPSKLIWTNDIFTHNAGKHLAVSGGLTYGDEVIYATNGSNYVVAISGDHGEVLWRVKLGNLIRSVPTYNLGKVFIISVDNKLYSLDAKTGEILWTHDGIHESLNKVNDSSVAIYDRMLVLPQSSGELYGVDTVSGLDVWRVSLPFNKGAATGFSLSDVDTTPIIRDKKVFVAGGSGNLFSLDIYTGNILWMKENLNIKSFWVADDFIYALSDKNDLVALLAEDGRVKWHAKFDEKEKNTKIKMMGPVLAGSRLIMIASNGKLFDVSPYDGSILAERDVSENVTLSPIVVDNKLYLMANNGKLIVLR